VYHAVPQGATRYHSILLCKAVQHFVLRRKTLCYHVTPSYRRLQRNTSSHMVFRGVTGEYWVRRRAPAYHHVLLRKTKEHSVLQCFTLSYPVRPKNDRKILAYNVC